jgi:tocopherol O-methyltransferase
MFEQKDIAEYYDTTQIHYKKWWGLEKHLSLHYGIWDKQTKSFKEAIINTNKLLFELSNISKNDKVLDAGCGVGGAAFYINERSNAKVIGVSLSQNQVSFAQKLCRKKNLKDEVEFQVMDFTKTSFTSESFDVVWACESVCHVFDKSTFVEESFRLLKKGGRLVMCDFFLTEQGQKDKNSWIDKWKKTWAIQDFSTLDYFISNLEQTGFQNIKSWNYTEGIKKSAKRMYYSAILGAISSEVYNIFHSKVSRFAKNHYKCGYYQYKALCEELWNYNMIVAEK